MALHMNLVLLTLLYAVGGREPLKVLEQGSKVIRVEFQLPP